MEKNLKKIEYICKAHFENGYVKQFNLYDKNSDRLYDSLYELTKWAKKFGAFKIELLIWDNMKSE